MHQLSLLSLCLYRALLTFMQPVHSPDCQYWLHVSSKACDIAADVVLLMLCCILGVWFEVSAAYRLCVALTPGRQLLGSESDLLTPPEAAIGCWHCSSREGFFAQQGGLLQAVQPIMKTTSGPVFNKAQGLGIRVSCEGQQTVEFWLTCMLFQQHSSCVMIF